ncbi:choice-of-anchor D domain-containing protein, partial [bacterium]|nr:choice-of-anchor D domain-containing protein [bacterium]
ATPVATTPVPVAAGGAQAATIAGLAPDETYHVAMRTFDEWGAYHERLGGDWSRNAAPLVTATFTTQPAPTIAVAPLNPFVKVRQGAAGACTVSVANVGTGVLDFAVSDPSGAGRVRFEPAAGTLLGGEAADILVTLDVAAQGCGETAYPLVVRSNDPTAAEVAVSITVGVTGPGDVEIADPQLAFGGVPVGERAALSLTVSNRGCSDLAVLATAFSNPDFAYGGGAMPGTPVLVIAPQSSGELPVLYAPTELAADTGTLLLTTADGDEPVVAVQLTGIGTTYPGAGLSADTVFSPQLWTNGSGTTLLGITNTGGADLTFAFAADLPPWLTIEPGGGTIAAGHTVQVAFAFSAAQRCGDATGSVSLTTNAPGQELLVIPCVALVTPAPVLDAPLVLHVDAVGALDVVNRGCAGHPLTISGVTFSDPQWCSTTTTFPRVVQPGRRSVISVEANHGGWTTSGMVIHSDDPLKPHYPVVIVGLGGPGAAAAIAPPSPEPGAALAVPNPFNPSTQLLLSLERSAAVTVDIFDVRGHRVRHAALGTRAAGMVSFDWNGRDDSGGALPSGTYFYRFSTDGESGGASGKLTLLR